jgi:4-carboxymuconolactone decarboxylase
MNARQRAVADAMAQGPRGHAGGLMGLWLHNPDLADRMQRVGEFLRFGGTLPGSLTEMAILLIAREWRCYHEWLVHAPLAEKKGLAPSVIETIRAGARPEFADPAEAAVHDYVLAMLREHRVPEATFAAVRELFGLAGIIELAGLIGHYVIGAATLNACEFDLPPGVAAPFA